MSCPDDNDLLAFVEGKLAKVQGEDFENHLDACAACRQAVSALAHALPDDRVAYANTDISEQARNAATMLASESAAAAAAARARARAEGNQPARSNASQGAVGGLLKVGTLVGNYRVKSLIGCGGMGEVYLARDVQLGRNVALKVLHRDYAGSAMAKKRLLLEARAMARFSHPNIVSIYGVGEHNDSLYLALEFLDGNTLRGTLGLGALDPLRAMGVGLAVAKALAEAHRHEILHRDLKPENVFIPNDGRVRVLDFGLAKTLTPGALVATEDPDSGHTSGDLNLTRGRSMVGTPAYMAPEQWRQEDARPTTDVWALGIMLYEMVVGRRPYLVNDPDEMCKLVTSDLPVPLEALQGRAPEEYVKLVRDCLTKERLGRPIAADAVAILQELVETRLGRRSPSGAVVSQPISPEAAPISLSPRSKGRVSLALVLIGTVVALFALMRYHSLQTQSTTAERRSSTDRARDQSLDHGALRLPSTGAARGAKSDSSIASGPESSADRKLAGQQVGRRQLKAEVDGGADDPDRKRSRKSVRAMEKRTSPVGPAPTKSKAPAHLGEGTMDY
jgi:serine/threonine protein kinase